jgi:CHAT domain-containing protein
MQLVSDVKVAALEFAVTNSELVAMWTTPSGARQHFQIGATRDLLPRIDALRGEMRDPMAICTGNTPRLREFAADWGHSFLPHALAADMPDVLVIVPHALTHDLPIHLILASGPTAEERPLGVLAGITYASSRSLFIRTVERNEARKRDLKQWHYGEQGQPADHPPLRSVMSGGVDVLGDLDPEFAGTCRLVAEHFAGERTVFPGDSFSYSRTTVKTALRRQPSPSVLCVMAHGWVDDDNHRMSGLLLERDSIGVSSRSIPLHGGRYFDFRDLPLRRPPHQIKAIKEIEVFTAAELEVDAQITCELVMLLGCSAGWGRVLQGDEPASLAETWLKIGAVSVVAPLWDAPIAAVRAWTAEFLHAWSQLDMPEALALRYAMQKMNEGSFHSAPERLGVMTLRGDWL